MKTLILDLHKKLLVMPVAALAILAAAGASLIVAYVAETFFDVQPCVLCIYQRVPYALACLFSALALFARGNDKFARGLLALCAMAFLTNMGIAIFHSGVELHYWKGTEGCAVNPLVFQSAEALRESLLTTPTVSCDEINFTFLGLTMANWNVFASLGLGLFALLAALGPCVSWTKHSCCCQCKCGKE